MSVATPAHTKIPYPTMPDLENFVTTEEAAKALHLHIETVREFLRDGVLQGKKVGYMWFVSKPSVAEYRTKTAGMEKNDPRRKQPSSHKAIAHS